MTHPRGQGETPSWIEGCQVRGSVPHLPSGTLGVTASLSVLVGVRRHRWWPYRET